MPTPCESPIHFKPRGNFSRSTSALSPAKCLPLCLDVRTGERLWQDRSFARSSFLQVGDILIVLDEDGVLGLARASREGLEVLARTELLRNLAWTAPTLAGSSLYARDRREIVKVELPVR